MNIVQHVVFVTVGAYLQVLKLAVISFLLLTFFTKFVLVIVSKTITVGGGTPSPSMYPLPPLSS